MRVEITTDDAREKSRFYSVMVAEHEIALLVAAHQQGVHGLDAGKLLDAIVKMQTALPQRHPGGGWVGNENLENYVWPLRHVW